MHHKHYKLGPVVPAPIPLPRGLGQKDLLTPGVQIQPAKHSENPSKDIDCLEV